MDILAPRGGQKLKLKQWLCTSVFGCCICDGNFYKTYEIIQVYVCFFLPIKFCFVSISAKIPGAQPLLHAQPLLDCLYN